MDLSSTVTFVDFAHYLCSLLISVLKLACFPEWTISVTTGKDANMTTTNEVSLCIYGENGCSEPITLGSGMDGKFFQRAQTDDFMVRLLPNISRHTN